MWTLLETLRYFRDADAEDYGSTEEIYHPWCAGADLENLRNVFFQKRPVSYDKMTSLGYDIASNPKKYMDRTFTCTNTANIEVNCIH